MTWRMKKVKVKIWNFISIYTFKLWGKNWTRERSSHFVRNHKLMTEWLEPISKDRHIFFHVLNLSPAIHIYEISNIDSVLMEHSLGLACSRVWSHIHSNPDIFETAFFALNCSGERFQNNAVSGGDRLHWFRVDWRPIRVKKVCGFKNIPILVGLILY